MVRSNGFPRLRGGRHFDLVILEEQIEGRLAEHGRRVLLVDDSAIKQRKGICRYSRFEGTSSVESKDEMSEGLEETESLVPFIGSFRLDELLDPLDDEIERVDVNSKVVFCRDCGDDGELCTPYDSDLDKVST